MPQKNEDIDPSLITKFDINQVEAGICKDEFYYFVKQFWETFDNSTPVWNFHIQYICQRLQIAGLRVIKEETKLSDILVSMPPGIGKSNILLLFQAWLWTLKPSIKIIGASYAMSISARDLAFKCKQIIVSDKYRLYFPYVEIKYDKGAESDFHNTKGGSRFSSSTDSTITGKRADIIIIDDPLNAQDSYSQKEREKTNKYIDDLSTRKVSHDYTLTILCQQRLHREDPVGHVLAQGVPVEYICLPAEYNKSLSPSKLKKFYDEKEGLLFPERLSYATLETERKKSLRTYNAQFLQNPTDDSDAVLKESWFPIVSTEDFDLIAKDPVIDFAIDSANTKNSNRNDPSVILAGCKVGNDLYITGLSKKWLETPKMLEHIKSYTSYSGYSVRSKIYIEPAQSGFALLQILRQQTGLNVVHSATQNKFSKTERLDHISSTVYSARVKLVKGPWNTEFLSEVCVPDSGHDDIKDTLCILVSEVLLKPKGTGKYHISYA